MTDETGGYPRKRARTRRRLLDAGMEALAARGPDGATVGEIVSLAEVAPGTFYNHFSSLDALVDAVVEQLGAGVEIPRDELIAIEHDPAARVVLGVLQLLEMADEEPIAASAFVALVAAKPEFRARIRAIVGRTISDGVDNGRFQTEARPATTNAVLGITLQSMRSRLLGETDASEAIAVAELTLRILGVEPGSVTPIVEATANARRNGS